MITDKQREYLQSLIKREVTTLNSGAIVTSIKNTVRAEHPDYWDATVEQQDGWYQGKVKSIVSNLKAIDIDNLSKAQASAWIDALKNGRYEA